MERLIDEFNDLLGVMELVFDCKVDELINRNKILNKKIKLDKYMQYSKELGILNNK